jgi:hypothetical protein
MYFNILLLFVLFNAINSHSYFANAQFGNYQANPGFSPLQLCSSLKINRKHIRKCQNGEHFKGSAYFKDPTLTAICYCVQLTHALSLGTAAATRIRMINTLG